MLKKILNAPLKIKHIFLILISFCLCGAGAAGFFGTITILGNSAPSLSSAGQANIYFDSTANTLKISQNASAYNTLPSGTMLGKNKIINGDFNVWQRGVTSQVIPVSGLTSYIADRWICNDNQTGTGRFTLSQTTAFLPNSIMNQYVLKVACSTAGAVAASSLVYVGQRIEAKDWSNMIGQAYTISFWVRSHIAQQNYVMINNSADGSYGYIASYTINSIDTWEKKVITITDPAQSSPTILAGSGYYEVRFMIATGSTFQSNPNIGVWQHPINFYTGTYSTDLSSNTANDIWFSLVQLELGNVATQFEYLSYQQELALCQRYCYVMTGAANNIICMGGIDTTSLAVGMITFPVTMRIAPTLTSAGTAAHFSFLTYAQAVSNSGTLPSNAGTASINTYNLAFNSTAAFPVAGTGGMLTFAAAATSADTLIFSSEL